MSDHRSDELKGRAKESVGDLTDDEKMKREGKTDQASASAKEKANRAVDKVKDTVSGDDR